jgi:NAD(P)-dependent dehydrogenase (short-subunit alcohol dehydrogenase family)
VAPGVVKTPTIADADYQRLAAQHPLGRMVEIGDIVQGVIYLEQATFVTGETLHIDGGQAAGH